MSSSDQTAGVSPDHRTKTLPEGDSYAPLRKFLGWLAIGYFVLFAIVSVYAAGPYKTFGYEWGSPFHRTDYTVYYLAGKAVLQHADIYAVRSIRGWAYVYPPPFAIAMIPLSVLPLPLSMFLYYAICAGLMAWAVTMAARLGEPQPATSRTHLAMLALPILLTGVWWGHSLARGQASALVAWLVIAAVYWEKRGRLTAGACCLAGAVLLKVFPLSLLAYYAWRGRWKFVAATLAAMIVGGLLLPALVYGWHGNLHYLWEFKQTVIDPTTMSEAGRSHYDLYDQLLSLGKPRNNALAPVLYRLFGGQQTPIISVLLAVLLGAVIFVVGQRVPTAARPHAEPLILGAVLTWALLVSPVAEDHYYSMMLLPVAFAVSAVLTTANPRRARIGRWVLILYGVLNFSGVFGHAFESSGVVCWAAVTLWLLLLYLASTAEADASSAPLRSQAGKQQISMAGAT